MDTQRLLEEFPGYLEAHRLTRPGHVPHLQRWACRYLDAPVDRALTPDDRLRVFLAALAQSPGVTSQSGTYAGNRLWCKRLDQLLLRWSAVACKHSVATVLP